MKTGTKVMGIVALATFASVAMAADDFAGTWTVEMEFQGQVRESKLEIKTGADGLTATWESRRGTNELSNVKVADGTITFDRVINRQGQEFSMSYSAKIEDGKLVGAITTPRGERPFTGIRAQEEVSFTGQWNVSFEFQGNKREAKLEINEASGALTGKWISQRGENELKNIKIADGTITFSRELEMQGQSLNLDYSAKIENGKLAGNIISPMGELPFSGEKIQPTEGGGRAAQMLASMDANGDGKITEDEAPDRMKQFFGMIDSNGDGGVDIPELEGMLEMMRQQGGGQN